MELTLEQALQKGVEAHKTGKVQEADRYYTAILKANPKHPDANHNMGVLAVGIGQVEQALPFFKTALDTAPKIPQFRLSYIDALIKLDRMADAKNIFEQAKIIGLKYNDFQHLEKKLYGSKVSSNWNELSENQDPPTEVLQKILNLYKDGNLHETLEAGSTLLSQFPKSSALLNVLGVTNSSLGKIEDAINAYKRAINLKPTNAEAYNNMAITLRKQGKSEEALEAYKKAILIDPNYAEAYNNMGVDLHNDGNLDEAIAAYTKALLLRNDYSEALNNMGNTLKAKGETENAIEYYSKALILDPKYREAAYNLGNVLRGVEFLKPNQNMQKIIALILDQNTVVRPKDIFFAAKSLLKLEPSLRELIAATSTKNQTMQVINSVQTLSNLPLLLKLMKLCPLTDIDLEKVLRKIRLSLLSSVSEISGKSELLIFQSALAVQCFINEYIYPESEIETHALKKLENIIEKEVRQGIKPSPNAILCLASYRPLKEYSWHNLLSIKDDIMEVFQIQVVEPELELSYAGQIPVFKKISNEVSSKVRKQYEVNPYPRWVNSELFLEPRSISTVIKELNLRIFDYNIHKVNAPNILIAGCGTGQHSINTASRFSASKVLAIDLSLSSLAYAKRKAEVLGISNIEHMQADILDFTQVNEEFDVVESSGVLHHMADPLAGWKVLTNCLKPGGLIKIGLYSKVARQDIKKLRKEIGRLGIQPNKKEMRNFRETLIKSKRKDHKNISLSSDFFSLSELRDLLFHVQEHTFTIPEIKKILTTLGLKFCGFEGYTILSHFKQTNPKRDYLYELNKWHAYEKVTPRAFSGMYQFWCQKVA